MGSGLNFRMLLSISQLLIIELAGTENVVEEASSDTQTFSDPVTNQVTKTDTKGSSESTPVQEGKRGEWSRLDNYYYYVSAKDVSKSFEKAELYCNQQNGTLALVKTKKIQDFIASLAAGNKASPYAFYIGLRDHVGNGTFIWNDKETITESFWGHSEPNNIGIETCVVMGQKYKHDPELSWNNVRCTIGTTGPKGFVCQTFSEGTTTSQGVVSAVTLASRPLAVSAGRSSSFQESATILMQDNSSVYLTFYVSPTYAAFTNASPISVTSTIYIASTVGSFAFLVLACLTLFGCRYFRDRKEERKLIKGIKDRISGSTENVNKKAIEMIDITPTPENHYASISAKVGMTLDFETSSAKFQPQQSGSRDLTYTLMAPVSIPTICAKDKEATSLARTQVSSAIDLSLLNRPQITKTILPPLQDYEQMVFKSRVGGDSLKAAEHVPNRPANAQSCNCGQLPTLLEEENLAKEDYGQKMQTSGSAVTPINEVEYEVMVLKTKLATDIPTTQSSVADADAALSSPVRDETYSQVFRKSCTQQEKPSGATPKNKKSKKNLSAAGLMQLVAEKTFSEITKMKSHNKKDSPAKVKISALRQRNQSLPHSLSAEPVNDTDMPSDNHDRSVQDRTNATIPSKDQLQAESAIESQTADTERKLPSPVVGAESEYAEVPGNAFTVDVEDDSAYAEVNIKGQVQTKSKVTTRKTTSSGKVYSFVTVSSS